MPFFQVYHLVAIREHCYIITTPPSEDDLAKAREAAPSLDERFLHNFAALGERTRDLLELQGWELHMTITGGGEIVGLTIQLGWDTVDGFQEKQAFNLFPPTPEAEFQFTKEAAEILEETIIRLFHEGKSQQIVFEAAELLFDLGIIKVHFPEHALKDAEYATDDFDAGDTKSCLPPENEPETGW